MTSKFLSRLSLLSGLFAALASRAGAEAQLGGEADVGGPAGRSVATPIVEVRGETPYVEIGGKRVAVSPKSIRFFPSDGPFRLYAKSPPAWVFASELEADKAARSSGKDYGRFSMFSEDLVFSVVLESPVLLNQAWVVVTLSDENVVRETYLSEVGTLRPYKSTRVTFRKLLHRELFDARVDWHLFAQGREVFNSLMWPDAVRSEMSALVSRAREDVKNAEAVPYLTFPPRDSSKVKQPVRLEIEIDRHGFIKTAAVADGTDSKVGKRLLEAVNHWWFLPQRKEGRSVDCRVSVVVDLSRWKTWSNDCLLLQPKPASSEPGTGPSSGPPEQLRSQNSTP